MNKIYYTILCCCLFSLVANAQTATEEALERACNCFSGVSFGEMAESELSLSADSCMQEALYTNLTGVLKENNTTLDDNEGMFKLAQLFQAHLLENCTGFQVFSKRLADQQVEEVKQNNSSNIGLLYTINTEQQFPVLTILTEDNEAIEFIWFREFDGSTRFMDGIKGYENTIVEIVWKDLELYDAVNKKYPFYKEILLVEELETIDKTVSKARIKAYKQKAKELSKQNKKGKKKK